MALRPTMLFHVASLRVCAFAAFMLIGLGLPIPIAMANTLPVSVAAGGSHTCVLRSDGSAICWGRNYYGQASPPAGAFTQLAAGSEYTCGIRTDGAVSCWGANYAGQSNPPSGSFTQISAGAYHSCGVKSDGSLACWGSNAFGQAAPPAGAFLQVSAGWSSSCAIRTDQTLTCWGDPSYGQIAPPTGTFSAIATGSAHSCGIRSDGSAACWGYNSAGQASPPGGTFTQISAGVYHTCALTPAGAIVCWGSNTNGQLSLPIGTFTQLDAGEYHTCAVHPDNTIGCWGYNGAGQAPSIELDKHPPPTSNVDTAYDLQFNAFGGTNPYSYSVTAGTLPAGLILSTSGRLSGTPTSIGIYSFAITAIDALRLSGSRAYTMTIETWLPITLSPNVLPSGRVGVSYTQQLSATHGLAPYTFAISAGGLPTGLTLSADGRLAGTPTATGTFSSTVQATDARGRTGSGIAAITVYRAASSDLTDSGAVLPGAAHGAAAWGDYDSDGDLDLALAGSSANGPVTRIYRNTNGSLIDSGIALPGLSSGRIIWGDYDNDGDLDLALAGTSANGPIAKIYRNAGVFSDSGVVLPGFGGPLAWGDYDNDGDLDLAIAGSGTNGLATHLFRDTNGSFTDSGPMLPEISPSGLAWGDYDNDGDLDLAIAGSSRYHQPFTYLLRNTDGSFSDSSTVLPGVANAALAWGDYDNDGDLDLAIAGNGAGGQVTAIYRNTNGSLSDSGAVLPGSADGALAWGDYDNDGDLDLALSGRSAAGPIGHLFQNTGNGFVESGVVFPGVDAGALAWGDYDNDGDLDLAFAGESETDAIAKIYRNNATVPNASPSPPGGLVATVAGTSATLRWDASGDSRTAAAGLIYNIRIGTAPGGIDIVAPMADISNGFRQLPQLGGAGHTRSWTVKRLLPGRTYYWSVQAIDASFAGSPFATESNFTVPNFEASDAGLPSVTTGALAWGDYDNDGDLDVVIAGDSGGTPLARVYQNTGGMLTDIAAGLPGVRQAALAWGDYDNDSDLDLALAGTSANGPITRIYRNTSASFVDTADNLLGVTNGAIAWGDYDNDGDLDLALAGTSANGPIAKIYRNGGGFSDSGISLAGVSEAALAWGDYDNDGDLDLALAGASANGPIARIYRNTGASMSDSGISLAGVSEAALAWGDYDNDGDLDLALTGTGTAGAVARLYQNTLGAFATLGLALSDSNAGPLAWGDYDNDGDLDILLSGAAGGRVYRNNMLVANRAPSAPTGLAVELGTLVTLRWGAANDTETPAAALTYNVRIGTTPGGSDVLAPMANAPGGYRRVPQFGNAGQRTSWSIRRLAPGRTYYWSVQAVDGTFAGSPFAAEGSFTLPLFGEVANTGLPGIRSGTVAWGDYDNDGDLDLALSGQIYASTTLSYVTRIYRNDGHMFSDMDVVLPGDTANALAWGDYDNDGDLDLLVGHAGGTQPTNSVIYRNDLGSFHGIDGGLPPITNSSLSWGDYDNDGDLDILLIGDDRGTAITRIFRNDRGQFADVGIALTGLYWGTAAWGDYDNDGDLDLLINGCTKSGGETGCERTLVYRNDGGSFHDINAGLPGTMSGSAVWGDYDSDGDLDILLTGNIGTGPIARVYRNTGAGFQDIGAALTPITYGAAAWGDYDNDGDLDILLSGWNWSSGLTKVYRNDGGQFADIGAGMVGGIYDAVAWGDVDNDGDLDALVTGDISGYTGILYRNNTAIPNRSPAAPTGLAADIAASSVTLHWNGASDSQTPAAGLSYNLRIGTTPGGSDVLAPMAHPSGGERRIPAIGNAGQHTSWTIRNLAPKTTYYWSVQSVDSAFAGSPFAQERSFTTPAPAQFAAATYTVDEQAGSMSLTILRNDGAAPLTLQYATSDGSANAPADYAAMSGNLTWASGDASIRMISIPIANDALDEASETFELMLRAAGTVVATTTVTIVDDDLPPVVQVEVPTSPARTSTGTAIFTVTLAHPQAKPSMLRTRSMQVQFRGWPLPVRLVGRSPSLPAKRARQSMCRSIHFRPISRA